MYKIKGNKLEKVSETGFKVEGKLEEDLETWVENDPSILGEDLLIMGRQVPIPEVKERIDLLAMDASGNTVIIELKIGEIKDPVDIQSLKYASYISHWDYDHLEDQARTYFMEKGEKEFNFNDKFEEFLSDAGIEPVPEIYNQDQRIIIVGSHVREKLGSVALWLRKHNIDVKVIEVSFFNDGGNFFLSPQTIIPLPTAEKFEIGRRSIIGDRPWINKGEEWHLDKRCGKAMKEKLLKLNDIITENLEDVEGPFWDQKFYVSFKFRNHIWLYINTHKTALILNFLVNQGDMKVDQISKELAVKMFDRTSPLSEKLQLESSVEVTPRREYDCVRLRIKEEFEVSSKEFLKFLKDCLDSFKKSAEA